MGYGVLALVALVQLIRIQMRVPQFGWTTQKVFHLLNAFVCVLRCVVLAMRDQVCRPCTGLLYFVETKIVARLMVSVYLAALHLYSRQASCRQCMLLS